MLFGLFAWFLKQEIWKDVKWYRTFPEHAGGPAGGRAEIALKAGRVLRDG